MRRVYQSNTEFRAYAKLVAPTTGFSWVIPANHGVAKVIGTATLAAGGFTLPDGAPDGESVVISSNVAITAVTVAAGPNSLLDAYGAALTTLAAGGSAEYQKMGNTWYRMR